MKNRMPSAAVMSKAEKSKSYKALFKSLSPYFGQIALSAVFIIISTVLSILAPQWLSKLTDEITAHAGTHSIDLKRITNLAIVLVVFYASNALCNYLSSFIMTTVTQKHARDVRGHISRKINRIPLKYYDSHQYGDTLSIITNDVDTIGSSLQQAVSMLISSVCLLTGVLIAMFVTCPQLAFTVLLIVPLMLILLLILTRFAMPQFRKRQIYLGELNGKVEENFTGQTVIKAFDAGARKGAEFETANKNMRNAMFRAQAIAGIMQPLMNFVSYFAYAAVCVVGGLLMNAGGGVTFGTITAFLVYVNLFQSPMSQLAQAMNSLQMAAASASRVYDFLGEEELSDESGKVRKLAGTDGEEHIRGEVEFKNVHFGYTPEKIIIPDFSAKVKPGMKVAIVGPTGAGKTTIVNLLMRFYELSGGDIIIDGVSVKDMPREEIHDIFGMVLQDTWLFEGSIRDNILFSKTNVSEEKLEEICKEAGIWHYVHTLPGGLDHVLENDSNVSGGQKQLITIARAMAENAPLLILDEATSNVDTRTEELIQRSMDKLVEGRTSFVIAHRLSTIKNADLILVMKDGNIIEQGSHDELVARNGFYAELYNSQFAGE